MLDCKIIGIDLAKTKFHFAAIDKTNKVIKAQKIDRDDFLSNLESLFATNQTFAFEACGGANYIAQELLKNNHKVILLKTKDVKA